MSRTPVSTIAQYAPCTIYVRGQVAYSRIASHVEGQELAKQNQEAAAKGRMPHAKPYTSISIKNPVILDNGKLPPQVKQVVQERFYTKQDGTPMFTQESKSPFLPTVVYSNMAGELAGQGIADKDVPLQAELAAGLDVTIGVSLFSKNGFAGLGMNYVLVNEPVRYYTNSAITADFAAAGITYVAPTKNTAAATTAPTQAYSQPAPVQQQTFMESAPQQSVFTPPTTPVAPQQPMSAPMPGADDVPWVTTPVQPVEPVQQAAPQVQRPTRYY